MEHLLSRLFFRLVCLLALGGAGGFTYAPSLRAESAKPGPGVLITGSYTYKMFDEAGKILRSKTHPFEARIGQGKYLFSTQEHNGDQALIVYSDGEDVYALKPRVTTDGRDIELCYVNRGTFPKFASAAAEILWLGLTPGSLQKNEAPAKAPLAYTIYSKNGKELDPAKTRYTTNELGYVRSAWLWCTEKIIINGETRYQLPPYHKGFEGGTFNAEGEVLVDGRYVAPRQFVFVVYTTKKGAVDAFDRSLFSRYEFTVEKAVMDAGADDLKLVSHLGLTHMRDYRFTEKAPLLYNVANGEWRKTNTFDIDRSKIAMMEAEAAMRAKQGDGLIQQVVVPNEISKKNRLIIGALIGCVVVFPPILFLRSKGRKPRPL